MLLRDACVLVTLTVGLGACGTKASSSAPQEQLGEASAALGVAASPIVVGPLSDDNFYLFAAGLNELGQYISEQIGPFANQSKVALGDINADGADEVLINGRVFDQFGVELPPRPNNVGFFPGDIIGAGDFHGQGRDDLVIGAKRSINKVVVISSDPTINDGEGPADSFPPQGQLAVCDLDNNGVDEIIVIPTFKIYKVDFVANSSTGHVAIEINETMPNFFAGKQLSFSLGDRVACADLNNDQFDELIVAHAQPPGIQGFYEIYGDPSRPAVSYFDPLAAPEFVEGQDISAGDLDGDGFAEVAIGGAKASTGGGVIRVISGPGKTAPAVFQGSTSIAVGGQTSTTSAFAIGRHAKNLTTDQDDDGIPDVWETAGIDVDGDGCMDFKPSTLLADPLRKDLFVELDAFDCNAANGDCPAGDVHDHMPTLTATGLGPVVDAFDQAPLTNPGGSRNGIHLVIQLDDHIKHQNSVSLDEARTIQQSFFGTAAERVQTASTTASGAACTTTPAKVLKAKALIFRYNLWGHEGDNKRTGVTPASNDANVAARFLVTLFVDPTQPNGPPLLQQGTFMHEFGHALGLEHGGAERFNWKPNYLSMMNYRYQGGLPTPSGTPKVDYSRETLPDLYEIGTVPCSPGPCPIALSELLGVQSLDATLSTTYNCPNGAWAGAAINGAIDWNCNSLPGLAGIATYPDLTIPVPSVPSSSETGVMGDVNGDRYCIDPDPKSLVLSATPSGDDFIMGGYINPGPNGVLQSATTSAGKQLDDLIVNVPQPPLVLIGFPDRVILPGPNNQLNTTIPLGVDDQLLFRVSAGASGTVNIVAGGDDFIAFDLPTAKARIQAAWGADAANQLGALPGLVPLLFPNGTVESTLGGDVLTPVMITPGPNGVLESATVSLGLDPKDVVNMVGSPAFPQIQAGPDGILQTAAVADELQQGRRIVDGKNRQCQSTPAQLDVYADEDGNGYTYRTPGSTQQARLKGFDDWHSLRFRFHNTGILNGFVHEQTVPEVLQLIQQATLSDVTLAVTASKPSISADSPVTFHVTLTNQGPLPALSASVSAALPSSMIIAACQASGGACSGRTALFPSIAAGASVSVDFTARVACAAAAGTSLQATFSATTSSRDPKPSDNVASVTTTVVGTKPVFTFVPPAVSTSQCVSPTLGQAVAVDACGGTVTVTNNRPTRFPLGRSVLTWTAVNATGGSTTATQLVVASLGDNDSCCPVGSNKIVGTSNNDVLNGTSGVDCILALGGQDRVSGGGGDDAISGGDGDDIIDGLDGNDKLYGGGGQDTLSGGNGNDLLNGGLGDDLCNAGPGADTLFGEQGQDRLNGEAGNDLLFGEQGTDTLNGGDGDDYLEGGPAGATAGTTDQCTGGAGVDTYVSCPSRPDDALATDACQDSSLNAGETALNCGGSGCFPCASSAVCQVGSDCLSGACVANTCTTANSPLYAALTITSDWGAGYCATLHVTNLGAAPTKNWSARIDTNQSSITSSWVGTFSGASGSVLITPPDNQKVIAAGARNGAIGFCANRQNASSMPRVIAPGATL